MKVDFKPQHIQLNSAFALTGVRVFTFHFMEFREFIESLAERESLESHYMNAAANLIFLKNL